MRRASHMARWLAAYMIAIAAATLALFAWEAVEELVWRGPPAFNPTMALWNFTLRAGTLAAIAIGPVALVTGLWEASGRRPSRWGYALLFGLIMPAWFVYWGVIHYQAGDGALSSLSSPETRGFVGEFLAQVAQLAAAGGVGGLTMAILRRAALRPR